MRKTFFLAAVAMAMLSNMPVAQARLDAKINLSRQTMMVSENGKQKYVWKISSGKDNFFTPTGRYRPTIVKRMHYSKKYDNAPMPYSVFFRGGYAIHGTKATWRLGRPASHGCVRLHTSNARRFHDLVLKHGKKATSIRVTGSTPSRTTRKVASSTKIISLGGKRLKPGKSRYARKRRTYNGGRRASTSRYNATGWNSHNWRSYSARMRRKQGR